MMGVTPLFKRLLMWSDNETLSDCIDYNHLISAVTRIIDNPYKQTFRKTNLWYRGADVDMLSREEATTIAESSVKWALESKLITEDEANKIRADVKDYFKEELVKLRTNEQLNEDSQNKFREALYNIAEKYIGKERTEKAMDLYQKNCEKQCKKDGSCNQPGIKKDCCKHD